jgi:hypothetical protein
MPAELTLAFSNRTDPIAAIDLERDVVKEDRPAKDFESCETVSIAESAQCPVVRCPAQLLSRNQTSLYAKIDIFFPVAITAGAQSATNVKCLDATPFLFPKPTIFATMRTAVNYI